MSTLTPEDISARRATLNEVNRALGLLAQGNTQWQLVVLPLSYYQFVRVSDLKSKETLEALAEQLQGVVSEYEASKARNR